MHNARTARNCVCWLAVVCTTVTGCTRRTDSPAETPPARAPARTALAADEPPSPAVIDLSAARIPPVEPQAVYIRYLEHRTTAMPSAGTLEHVLDIVLRGLLERTGTTDDGDVEAKLSLERIQLAYGLEDQPDKVLRYDSARPEKHNPLADLMEIVADAELDLRISPEGRLLEAHGLDRRWRKAKLLMAPPALLAAQWQFRDAGMTELLAKALFPELPAEPIEVGDTWKTTTSTNIPVAARLEAHADGSLKLITGHDESATAWIEATGQITPVPEVIAGRPPGLRPTVEAGTWYAHQAVTPQRNAMKISSQHDLTLQLALQPPQGPGGEPTRIKQHVSLKASRGRVPTAVREP